MPAGGAITVRASNRSLRSVEPDLDPGDYVVIRVEDTRKGIPPEIIERVLEPFFTTKELRRHHN